MTIDKTKTIVIPQYLLSLLVSILTTAFITWGILTAAKATLELRATNIEKKVEKLDDEKVNKAELDLMIQGVSIQLKEIKAGVRELKQDLKAHQQTIMGKPASPTSMLQQKKLYN